MTYESRSDWQLPRGVARGTWDYTQSELIATDYDHYFADKELFELDQQLLDLYFRSGVVIDFGAGSGRALLPLARKGLRGIAVDLSQHMLRVVQAKSRADDLPVDCLRANLVELDCLATHSAEYAMCLFSTLGMVRGAQQRNAVVRHVGRILKPRGIFILQVHNYWAHLLDPDGPWWMLRNALRCLVRRDVEIGDKFFLYRGIPRMYLHSFSRRELKRLLQSGGLQIVRWLPLNATQSRPLPKAWLLSYLRASGWIVVCESICKD